MLMHYNTCGCGFEANIALVFASCYRASQPHPCAIFGFP